MCARQTFEWILAFKVTILVEMFELPIKVTLYER